MRLKLIRGKIDLPFVKEALGLVLIEGRDGGENKLSDEEIAKWCFEFYMAYSPCLEDIDCSADRYNCRSVALSVATQWEADCDQSEGRVLSAEQFGKWVEALA